MGNTESDKDQRYGGNFWHALYPLLTTEQGRVQPYYPVAMKNNVCFVSYPPPTAHSEENWKILIQCSSTRGEVKIFARGLLHCSSLFGDKKIYIFAKILNEGEIAFVNQG